MPNPNALVAQSLRIDPERGRGAATILREGGDIPVQLDGERVVHIAAGDERAAGYAQVLEGLARLRSPAYLEIDPATSAIVRLEIPHVARVGGVHEGEKGLEIALVPSQGVHLLGRDSPWFDEFAVTLKQAEADGAVLIVSTDELHQVLDVRAFKPGPDDLLPPWPKPKLPPFPLPWWKDWLDWIWRWKLWPWNWFRCISKARAQQAFDAMSATTCNPLTIPPGCIPFLYPDDGCWARAHEMCRLMIASGLRPKKVWIQGSLHTLTRNNPQCYVNWGWHVAPTLCVRTGWFSSAQMVIDPSLFTTPVTQATWKGVQGDPNASLTPSDAEIYYLWGNVTDPTYSETNYYLAYYRLALQNRSNNVGSPPYANCP